MFPDLRAFLAHCAREPGNLLPIPEPVDPVHEVAAVVRAAVAGGDGPAVLFESVRGYPGWRLVSNVLGTRQRAAALLGVAPEHLKQTFMASKEQGLAPRQVTDGAVKEVLHKGGVDLRATLPVPTFHALDAGPFITSGTVIARDPRSGQQNLGIHRMQVLGPDRLSLFLANPPLADYLRQAEAAGEPLPVAVAVAPDPYVLLAAVARAGVGARDKLELAGGLAGAPVPVVRAETADIWVPAFAELVIEGEVLPGVREAEGPFGESTGYYFQARSPVVQVKAITHRKDPLFQFILPWSTETDMLLLLASASELLSKLQEFSPHVRDLTVVPGTCNFQVFVSVSGASRAEVRRIMHLALNLDRRIKQVTVVDDDVDIYDLREVMWAVATRFQADRDLLVLTGMEGYAIDPSVGADGQGSKLGLDATRPAGRDQSFARITVPAPAAARAAAIVERSVRAMR